MQDLFFEREDMKKITLTKGKVALVDDEDFEWLSRWKWRSNKCKNGHYAIRWGNWKTGEMWNMHRLIMKTPKHLEVDHINGDGLDNRKENLRNCTRAQNARNHSFSVRNSTGYKGVQFDSRPGRIRRWYATTTMTVDGKKKHLSFGYHMTAIEAAKAYDKGVSKLWGEYAKTNFNI